MSDLRADLQSGDPGRQVGALVQLLGQLAGGHDVSNLVSLVCQAVLAAPNTAHEPKTLAYDLVTTAPLSDADWARVAVGVKLDLQKEAGREVRQRALRALPLLPPHRLAVLLADGALLERLVVSIRSTSDAVRAAAIECFAILATEPAVLSQAASSPGLLSGLIDAWELITNGLTDESDVVCAAACAALSALLAQARRAGAVGGSAAGGGSGGGGEFGASPAGGQAVVLQDLVRAVHSRGACVLALALARFRVLNTLLLTHVPPLLLELIRSQRPPQEQRALSTLPGELPPPPTAGELAGAAGAHFYDEAAALLVELLGMPAQPVMLAAADALLQLAEAESASAQVQATLPRAVASLMEAIAPDTPDAPATLPQVLPMLLSHLSVLPPQRQVALFHNLLPLVAALPSAAGRTKALSQLWLAVLEYDWSGRAARRAAAGMGGAAPELQMLLADPKVKEIVSGVAIKDEGLGRTASGLDPRLVYPAFREELVGSLLHLVLTHNRAAALEHAEGSVASGASTAVAEAVRMQGLVEIMEWLGSAKIALQGCKACLGWDRSGSGQGGAITTGATAVVDLWLQLLLTGLQVSQALRATLTARLDAPIPAPAVASEAGGAGGGVASHPPSLPGAGGPASYPGSLPPGPASAKEGAGREGRPGEVLLGALQRRLGAVEMDMQGMLLQIATNWRALHPAVRPRAVWICAAHLRFKSALDSGWNGIVDAVRGLLMEARKTEASNYVPAVSEGLLAARKEDGSARPGAGAAGAAAATQSAEVALLCLERLALLLAHNNKPVLIDGLQPIAALLKKVAEVESEREGVGPAAKERLTRLLGVLGPVATGGKKSDGGRRGNKENEAGGQGNGLVVVDLVPDPAQPLTAAYPLTLPSAAAQFRSMEARRYRSFLSQLQAAQAGVPSTQQGAAGASGGSSTGAGATPASDPEALLEALAPAGGLPTSLLDLTAVLAQGEENAPSTSQQEEEVTGPASPLGLTLSHSVDSAAGAVTVRCRLANKTLEELRGVEVHFIPGGPLAPDARRPLTFRLEPLPPAESTSWDVRLAIAGFGGPLLQPSIVVPVKLPEGEPVLRCKPYAISPLSLLAPPAARVTAAEFYQRWQALPHRAQISGAATEAGVGGLQHVLARLERTPMACVAKTLSPVQGALHAALHGAAWGGEVLACVVTGGLSPGVAGGAGSGRLTLHFRSDSAEVVAHIQGHEGEMLQQLTGGLVVPAGGAAGEGLAEGPAVAELPREEPAPRTTGFMSFLRGVTTRDDYAGEKSGGKEEGGAKGEGGEGEGQDEEAVEAGRLALEREVLAQWQRLRAMRAV